MRTFCNTRGAWNGALVFLRIVSPPYYGRDCAPAPRFAHGASESWVFRGKSEVKFLFLGEKGLRAARRFAHGQSQKKRRALMRFT